MTTQQQTALEIANIMERMAERRTAAGDPVRAEAFWVARNMIWDTYDLEEPQP